MNNNTEGKTPKQATITLIEQIPSRHGGWIYDVHFDCGWRCYVDPNNNNYRRWRQICERKQLVTLRGLRAKSKHKRIYNADSKIEIVGHAMSDELTPYEELFDRDATAYQGELLEQTVDGIRRVHHLMPIDIATAKHLLQVGLPKEFPQFTANCNDSETELWISVDTSDYIIPLTLDTE